MKNEQNIPTVEPVNPAPKLLYDVPEAAARLGVKASWLYERTRRNALPCRRLGKYVRFSEADLHAIMENSKVEV